MKIAFEIAKRAARTERGRAALLSVGASIPIQARRHQLLPWQMLARMRAAPVAAWLLAYRPLPARDVNRRYLSVTAYGNGRFPRDRRGPQNSLPVKLVVRRRLVVQSKAMELSPLTHLYFAKKPEGPYSGYVMVVFAEQIAGPKVGQFFAEHGGIVVYVERKNAPDPKRKGPPTPYNTLHKNSLCITLDKNDPDSVRRVQALLKLAHVFVDARRSGAKDRCEHRRYAIGYSSGRHVTQKRPLVVVDIAACPPDSPMRDEPTYDRIVQAYAGIGDVGKGRAFVEPLADDIVAHKAYSTLQATLHYILRLNQERRLSRECPDNVVFIEENMVHCLIDFLDTAYANYVDRMDIKSPYTPFAFYKTQDGMVAIATTDKKHSNALANALGLSDEVKKLMPLPGSRKNRQKVKLAIREAIQTMTTDKACTVLREAGVPVGSCLSVKQVLDTYSNAYGVSLTDVVPSLSDEERLRFGFNSGGETDKMPADKRVFMQRPHFNSLFPRQHMVLMPPKPGESHPVVDDIIDGATSFGNVDAFEESLKAQHAHSLGKGSVR